MKEVRHRKEPKTRTSAERKLASDLESEQTSAFGSNTPNFSLQNLRESLTQPNPGHSLDPNLKAELEPQFGHNFGNVRVHADTKADQLAKSINANAFTTGQDVYFRAGMFKPESAEGKQLLAHELTHTVQQARAANTTTAEITISQPGDQSEQVATRQASAVMDSKGTPVMPSSNVQGILIQRDIHDASATTPAETSASSATTPSRESEGSSGTPGASTRAEFQSATRAYEAGRYLEAAQAFEDLARRFPSEQQDLLYNACRAYEHLGQNLEGRRVNRDIEDAYADPATRERSRQAMTSGIQAYQSHEYARAAQLFRDAYQAIPAPEFQFNVGIASLRSGHPADALEAFEAARAGGVSVPRRLIRQAEEERNRTHDISSRDLEALLGSEDEAIDAIVSEASLGDARIMFHTATRSFMDRNYNEAIRQFEDIQAVVSRSQGRPDLSILWNEARAQFNAGNYEQAVPLYRQSLSL